MYKTFKKFFFNSLFNFCIFIFLIIGIQNSSNKSKVYFYGLESIKLPISFIIGFNFIVGSITGGVFSNTLTREEKE